jgi:WD40 repeat protein
MKIAHIFSAVRYFVILLVCFYLIFNQFSQSVQSQELSKEPAKKPILRIETEMHTAVISRIGVDAENQYLVTGSNDKTVRLWELATGNLIKTFRPPIGNGDEGEIYAVAISPDGQTIAGGGYTDDVLSIYLFDRLSGQLSHRITKLSNVITHLTYSMDGEFLVACVGGNNGIRIYRTSDYSLVAEDTDYGDTSYDANFDINDRLVTTSYDGFIRLYNKDFKMITKEMAPGGKQPFSASFSPDGLKIAVGFSDSTKVDIISSKNLSFLYSPDTSNVYGGSLSGVVWSLDGKSIYAGGGYVKNTIFPILKWTEEGKGKCIELVAGNNTITSMVPLKKGGIVFVDGNPSFGVFDKDDKKIMYQRSLIADYRNNKEGFLVSNDGTTIQCAYESRGKSPFRFYLLKRQVELTPDKDNLLATPIIFNKELRITDWDKTNTPKLNGNPLNLKQHEFSRSLTIASNQEVFLLGTEWYLRLFDRDGSEKWTMPVSIAWAVNITGNNKLGIAALGDGTIRWYRLSDGKELLAFFPHRDKKRWILWTPLGYYDASPGAESLIGWHINRGKDQAADFFPASKFKSKYYRPDIVGRILETLDEDEALRIANELAGRKKTETSISQMAPPIVNILAPADGSEISINEIIVRYNVRSSSEETITAVKALVDGRPVANKRGISIVPRDKNTKEMKVTIPERDCEVSILAENKYSTSEPATIRLKWKGKTKTDEFVIKPKLYVLSIGISKYDKKDIALQFASKDAKDFAEIMETQKDALYRDVILKVLTNEQATKDSILDGLDWIQKETTSKDVAMIFLAGHGVNDPSGIYYFLPANADTEKLKRTGVAFSDIKNTVSSLAGKTILFVDTCHSGNIMGGRRGVVDINAFVNELIVAENGAVVFSSSSGNQYSLEDAEWQNGAFTKALVEGIKGKADYTGKGKITINMLDLYLSERVKELTKGKQTPTTTKPQTVPDFPVAVKK